MSKLPPLSRELAEEAYNVWEESGRNTAEAARKLGLSRSGMQGRLAVAARYGITGNLLGDIGPGQQVLRTTTLFARGGEAIGQWVQAKPDTSYETVTEAIQNVFAAYEGGSKLVKPPKHTVAELATFYNIADQHLGLYAWKDESGEDYDLDIGEDLLLDTMAQLVALSPPSEQAVVLNLGDFFHSDSDENRTRRSGNQLDVDTRYAKVLQTGVKVMTHCIDLAKQRHQRVLVRNIPGNHDPYATLALAVALGAFYRNDPRVTVDTSPSPFFKWRFGRVLVTAAHGDMVKPSEMPGMVASRWPQDWGETDYRYAYFGHVHHKSVGGGEKQGLIWETFQTLAARDNWHYASGYSSGRSMVSITHHMNEGEKYRNTVSFQGPR